MENKRLGWIIGIVGGVVLGLAIYLFASPAEEPSKRAVFKPGWELCDEGDACVAVAAPCGDWQPVNKKHEAAAAAYYSHLITVVEEGEMMCMSKNLSKQVPTAWCVTGACILSQ